MRAKHPGLFGGTLLALLAFGLPGCMGASSGDEAADGAEVEAAVDFPEAQLEASWVVALAEQQALQGYASEGGWISLVMKRDYGTATRQLGGLGGVPAARAHGEAAALYRQAALLSANSLIEVYGKTPQETDPVGTAHLLTVSYAIAGDLDEAKEAAATMAEVEGDPTAPWHGPWASWLDAGGTWPPDLSGLPMELPEVAPGGWPEAPAPPHYSLPEQGGSEASRDMGDPGALVALALWHDAAAEKAAGDQWPVVRSARAAYRLPVEPPVPAAGDVPLDVLFGSDSIVPGDAAFMAAVAGDQGAAAIDAHAETSLLAWMARESRVDGAMDHEKAIDLAAELREALLQRSAAKTGGTVEAHHREFANIAKVGALRSLAIVAEIEGDRETGGHLRINAKDMSDKATACPVGLLALAAWDAGNRYPLRGLELLHAQARRYPSLEVARYGLDVLGLRVSNERIETPGM